MTTAEHEQVKAVKREVAELRRPPRSSRLPRASSRPSSTVPGDGDRLHHRAQGPPRRGRPAVGCRALVRRVDRAWGHDRALDVFTGGSARPHQPGHPRRRGQRADPAGARVEPAARGPGSRKMWLHPRRQGHDVARCTIERLYPRQRLGGARYGEKPRTTVPDESAARPADRVGRDFSPSRSDRLWVADFTHVPTWTGMVYVAHAGVDWDAAPPRGPQRCAARTHGPTRAAPVRRAGDVRPPPTRSQLTTPPRAGLTVVLKY